MSDTTVTLTDTTVTDGTDDAAKAAAEAAAATAALGASEAKGIESLPQWAQKQLTDARNEAAKARTDAKAQAVADAEKAWTEKIGKAFGFVKDGEAPTTEQLAEQVTAAQNEARQTKVELAVFKAASTIPGLNTAHLFALNPVTEALKGVDPADDTAVRAVIDKAITDFPFLKPVQATGVSGADFTGGSGDGAITAEKFKAMSYEDKAALYLSNPSLYESLSGRK